MTTINLKTLHEQANNDAFAFEASLTTDETQDDLTLCVSDDAGLNKLGDPFRLSTLSEAQFDILCHFIETNPNLTDIQFNATLRNLNKERLTCLLTALAKNTHLKKIHLSNNGISETWHDEHLDLLVMLIQNNERLTTLDLSANHLDAMNPEWARKLLEVITRHKRLETANIAPDAIVSEDRERYLGLLLDYAGTLPSAHFSGLSVAAAQQDLKARYDAFIFALLSNERIKHFEIDELPEDKALFVDSLEKNTTIHTATWIQAQRKNSNPSNFNHEKETTSLYHDYYTNIRMSLIVARNYLLYHDTEAALTEPTQALIDQFFIFLECYATLYLDTNDLSETHNSIPVAQQVYYAVAIECCRPLYNTLRKALDSPDDHPAVYQRIPEPFKTDENTRLLYLEMIENAEEQHQGLSSAHRDNSEPLQRERIRAWLPTPTHEKRRQGFLQATLARWRPRVVHIYDGMVGLFTPEFFRSYPCKHTISALTFSEISYTEEALHLSQLSGDTFDALCQFIATLPQLHSVLLNRCLEELADERTEQLIESLIQNKKIRHLYLQSGHLGLKRETTQRALVTLVKEKKELVTLDLINNHIYAMNDALFGELVEAAATHPNLTYLHLHAPREQAAVSDEKLKTLTQHAASLPCDDFSITPEDHTLYSHFLMAYLQNTKITRINLSALLQPLPEKLGTLKSLATVFERNTAVSSLMTAFDKESMIETHTTPEEANYSKHSLYQEYCFQRTNAEETLAGDAPLPIRFKLNADEITELTSRLNEFSLYLERRTLSMVIQRNHLLRLGEAHLHALQQQVPLHSLKVTLEFAVFFIASFYELYAETQLPPHPQRDIPEDCKTSYCQAIVIAAQLTFRGLATNTTLHDQYDIQAHYDRLMMCALYLIRKNIGNINDHKAIILECAKLNHRTIDASTTDPIAWANKIEPKIQATHRNNQPERGDIPKTHPYLKDTWLKTLYGYSLVFSGAQSRPQTPANASMESASMAILNLSTEALLQERSKEDIKAMRERLKALTEKERATLKADLLTLTENCKKDHDPLFDTLKACVNHPEKYYFFTILQTGSSSGKPITLFHNTGSFNKFMEMIKSGVEERLSVVSPF